MSLINGMEEQLDEVLLSSVAGILSRFHPTGGKPVKHNAETMDPQDPWEWNLYLFFS